nr:MAG TPA: hypothetical protein [Caudoviricetes sp.]
MGRSRRLAQKRPLTEPTHKRRKAMIYISNTGPRYYTKAIEAPHE